MPFKVTPPQNYEFRVPWRQRIAQINQELADETSPLALEFAEAERIAAERGDLAAQAEAAAIARRRPDLFPGIAGQRLAWSTLCGSPPPLQWKEPGESESRMIFDEPVPDFTPTFSRTGKNRYSNRSDAPATDKRLEGGVPLERVLTLLRRGRSAREIADRLGQSEEWLRTQRHRLQRRKDLRTFAWAQRVLSLYERGLRAVAREHAVGEAVSSAEVSTAELEQAVPEFRIGDPTVRMPIAEAEARTGFTSEQLKEAGVLTYTRSMQGSEVREEFAFVPRSLLLYQPPAAP